MHNLFRILGLAAFFVLCYHLDSLLEMLFARTDFFQPAVETAPQGWFDRLTNWVSSTAYATAGTMLERLTVIASKIVWPFLFAAVAVPVLLPHRRRARNRWSAALTAVLTVISVILFLLIKNDFAALWHAVKNWYTVDVALMSGVILKIKSAMVCIAINLTLFYIWLYRMLHAVKLEQMLYFLTLCVNALYVILPDPIPGAVDDAIGIVVTAFLSMAIFLDRLLTKE